MSLFVKVSMFQFVFVQYECTFDSDITKIRLGMLSFKLGTQVPT